jgi:hypothetical protein
VLRSEHLYRRREQTHSLTNRQPEPDCSHAQSSRTNSCEFLSEKKAASSSACRLQRLSAFWLQASTDIGSLDPKPFDHQVRHRSATLFLPLLHHRRRDGVRHQPSPKQRPREHPLTLHHRRLGLVPHIQSTPRSSPPPPPPPSLLSRRRGWHLARAREWTLLLRPRPRRRMQARRWRAPSSGS